MTLKTTEFIINVLVSTPDGNQEPLGFMMRAYARKNTDIKKISCDIKSQIEKLQTEIL